MDEAVRVDSRRHDEQNIPGTFAMMTKSIKSSNPFIFLNSWCFINMKHAYGRACSLKGITAGNASRGLVHPSCTLLSDARTDFRPALVLGRLLAPLPGRAFEDAVATRFSGVSAARVEERVLSMLGVAVEYVGG